MLTSHTVDFITVKAKHKQLRVPWFRVILIETGASVDAIRQTFLTSHKTGPINRDCMGKGRKISYKRVVLQTGNVPAASSKMLLYQTSLAISFLQITLKKTYSISVSLAYLNNVIWKFKTGKKNRFHYAQWIQLWLSVSLFWHSGFVLEVAFATGTGVTVTELRLLVHSVRQWITLSLILSLSHTLFRQMTLI